MDSRNFGGILGQIGAPARVRGRQPQDNSYYTYGAAPRPNSAPPVRVAPGLAAVRGANFASGGAASGPDGPGRPPGMLQAAARASGHVQGAGTGRSDEIDAKLSNGEYVMDAETVSLLGDGSTEAGAKRLDELRKNLRSHKGKALAKGKFSPAAKKPEQYLKGT